MQPINGAEVENRIGGSYKEGNVPILPSGQITNPTEDSMAVLCFVDIVIDDENYPTPWNIP